MNRLHLSLEAQRDLEAIWRHIAADNIEAADRLDQKLRQAFNAIAANPRIGHTRTDLTSLPVLFWPIGNYLILYRNQPRSIEVVAISHGARDIPTLLTDRIR